MPVRSPPPAARANAWPWHRRTAPLTAAAPPQTNNPRKIRLLEALGVSVTGRIPCLVKPGEFSSSYLEAKGRRMDHLDLDGSWCYWDHSGEKDPPHPPKPVDEQTF